MEVKEDDRTILVASVIMHGSTINGRVFWFKEDRPSKQPSFPSQTRTETDHQIATPSKRLMSTPATKIGPYGGPGGNAWDIYTKPKTLVSVQVWSNDFYRGGVINGISFIFVDEAGKSIPSGPWGTKTGEHHMINLIQDERMISISGTTDGKCITSLKFVTDKAVEPYGPYGAQSEEGLSTFSFPATIIAFFGSSSEKLNAIGTYTVQA